MLILKFDFSRYICAAGPESSSCAAARRRTLSLWPHVPSAGLRGYRSAGAHRRSLRQKSLSLEHFVRDDNPPLFS